MKKKVFRERYGFKAVPEKEEIKKEVKEVKKTTTKKKVGKQ